MIKIPGDFNGVKLGYDDQKFFNQLGRKAKLVFNRAYQIGYRNGQRHVNHSGREASFIEGRKQGYDSGYDDGRNDAQGENLNY